MSAHAAEAPVRPGWYASLLLGVFACSTSVIFIRASTTDPVFLSALRLLVAVAFLAPWYARAYRRAGAGEGRKAAARAVVPGLLLAFHFITWIAGARMTPAANSTLIVNLVPVVMPLLLLFWAAERPDRRELAATAIAVGGLVVLGVGDFRADPRYLVGDIVCFVSMLGYAAYLAAGRRNRDLPELALYLVPVYAAAGIACLALGVGGALLRPDLVAWPADLGTPRELGAVLGLALLPTVVGHTLINRSLTRLRGQVVSVVNLAQFLFAGAMAAVLLDESPGPSFLPASVLVVAGALLVVLRPPNRSAR